MVLPPTHGVINGYSNSFIETAEIVNTVINLLSQVEPRLTK